MAERVRPQSAPGRRGKSGRPFARPRSAKVRRDARHCTSELVKDMEVMVRRLASEKRLVEAVTLAQRLVEQTSNELSASSPVLRHACELAFRLMAELGGRQEEQGSASDVRLALDVLGGGVQTVVEKKLQAREREDASPDDERWCAQCSAHEVLMLTTMASCHRRLGEHAQAAQMARQALKELKLVEEKIDSVLMRRKLREAQARCHLVQCTITSSRGHHAEACEHARIAVACLESVAPPDQTRIRRRLNRVVVRSLGIAYYNVGAELEHLFDPEDRDVDVDVDVDAEIEVESSPAEWYEKALRLSTLHASIFADEVRAAFERTVASCKAAKHKQRKAAKHKKKAKKKKAIAKEEHKQREEAATDLEEAGRDQRDKSAENDDRWEWEVGAAGAVGTVETAETVGSRGEDEEQRAAKLAELEAFDLEAVIAASGLAIIAIPNGAKGADERQGGTFQPSALSLQHDRAAKALETKRAHVGMIRAPVATSIAGWRLLESQFINMKVSSKTNRRGSSKAPATPTRLASGTVQWPPIVF